MKRKKLFWIFTRLLPGQRNNRPKNIAKHIQADSDLSKEMSQIKKIWERDINIIEPKPVDEMWHDFQTRLRYEKNAARQALQQHSRNRRAARRSLGYAFAVILLLMLPVSLYVYSTYSDQQPAVQYSEIRVPNGQRHTLQLSDGSRITLDAGSYLRYPDIFKDKRVVHLKGEAYFEVASNPHKPFIVHANQTLIQVLGTKFNIRAWESNRKIQVAVKEGLVSFRRADSLDEKIVYIEGNQTSIIQDQNPPTPPRNTDINEHLGWMQNEIRFESASIGQVFQQLERWYDYDFVINDSSILSQKVTVHILNTNVNDVLQIMGRLTGTQIEQEGNIIHFINK